jgi:hypothetical protein
MKKPLCNDEEIFFSLIEGKISALSADQASGIIKMANQSLKRGSSGQILVLDESLVFEDCVLWWLERLAKNEPIGELTDDLNERIRGIPFIHLINPDESGEPRWEHIAVLGPATPTATKAAHAVSLFLASGGLKKLRRCQADECQQFFLGPSNRKWCSENCGSRMRGRRLRERRRRHRYAP